jgi:two-component system, cell cycle response regulator
LPGPVFSAIKFVSRLLEARHHEVRPFVDEREALDYIKSDVHVDALITSAELTAMSGIELCWEARLLATHRRQIYVIMMSSNNDQHRLAEALDGGADDFIGKPPVPEELYARLRAAERLARMQRELIRLATTDPLTGVFNRRAFFELAQEACSRLVPGAMLSAIMFDIDHFKRINDAHGRDVGDEAIGGVARAAGIESAIVGRAHVGRIGGEELSS